MQEAAISSNLCPWDALLENARRVPLWLTGEELPTAAMSISHHRLRSFGLNAKLKKPTGQAVWVGMFHYMDTLAIAYRAGCHQQGRIVPIKGVLKKHSFY